MTRSEKLIELGKLLGVNIDAHLLNSYLDLTRGIILEWYGDESLNEVPCKFDHIQIQACIIAYSARGAEGQTSHDENGISRDYGYPSVVEYIHANIIPLARIV